MNGSRTTVCFPFVGSAVGGSHFSALGLIRALDQSRFDPIVLVQDQRGPIATLFRESGIQAELAPTSPSFSHGSRGRATDLLALAWSSPGLARFLRQLGADIVHTNDGHSHATWALPAKLAGARLVWHHRGSPEAIGKRLLAPILADQIISVSEFAARPRRFAFPAARSAVVHSPFDTSVREDRVAARQELLRQLGCAASTCLIGFFGALTARKRPLLFVDAIAQLIERAPGLSIQGVVFGEAFDVSTEMIRECARLRGVEHAIHVMGFRMPGSRWIAACDVLMVPAVDEPFGRTLIEAMLVGTPIVATRSGGNVEALRNGELGVLVASEDAGALAAGLLQVISEPDIREAVVLRAQADSRTRFGIMKHAEAVMALYDDLLQRGSRLTGATSAPLPRASIANSAEFTTNNAH